MNDSISMVIPTRGNVVGLRRTLASLVEQTSRLDLLQVLLMVDNDDPEMPLIHDALSNASLVKWGWRAVPRSEHFCRDYYNGGAALSDGDMIMMFNDDCAILTKGWDDLVRRAAGARKVFCIAPVDTSENADKSHPEFPKFPIISRGAYELLGQFFYPQIRMWGADTVCYKLYSLADCIIPCPEVRIQHDQVPSARFQELFEKDIADKVFPVDMTREYNLLKEAHQKEEELWKEIQTK